MTCIMANTPHFNMADITSQWDAEPFCTFELEGETFTIPAVGLWPDRMPKAVNEQARVLLGDQFDRYAELGGTGRMIDHVIREVVTLQGVATPGE